MRASLNTTVLGVQSSSVTIAEAASEIARGTVDLSKRVESLRARALSDAASRSLAVKCALGQRSAVGAKEIKMHIDDGSALVEDAGGTIEGLVASVCRVMAIMSEGAAEAVSSAWASIR